MAEKGNVFCKENNCSLKGFCVSGGGKGNNPRDYFKVMLEEMENIPAEMQEKFVRGLPPMFLWSFVECWLLEEKRNQEIIEAGVCLMLFALEAFVREGQAARGFAPCFKRREEVSLSLLA